MNQPTPNTIESVPWPKDDEIRWVEWRIREREGIESGRRSADWGTHGRCSLQDYRAWILHKRDGISFQKIGDELFVRDADPDNRKMKAYRACTAWVSQCLQCQISDSEYYRDNSIELL